MFQLLKESDRELFLLINGMHSGFFDIFFYYAAERYMWIPFYVFLALAVYRHSGKNFIWLLVSVTVLILFSDQLTNCIKGQLMRLRPCHNPELASHIHLVKEKCGGTYGFVSAHAANSSGLSVFLILLFRKKIKWLVPAMISYVMLLSYSRIYLGMHYPSDVAGGWLVGILCGLIIFRVMRLSKKLTGWQY